MDKVGCAGIVVADLFCGPMDRLPSEGELLALDTFESRVGGCAANVAVGLAKQGVAVDISGCVGKDAAGEGIVRSLQACRIDCGSLVHSQRFPTSQTVILLVKGQDRRFVHVFGANREYGISHINREWLRGLKVFYLGGLFALPGIRMEEMAELLRFCRENDILTVVDVVVPQAQSGLGGLDRVLPYIDYFLPNDQEAQRLTGMSEPREQIRVLRRLGARTVIITRGAAGALTACGDELLRSGIFAIETVDPSGSGDAFSAGVITGIVRGCPIRDALNYAAALGASATRAVGCTDGVFTAAEADQFLKSHALEIIEEIPA